MYRWFLIDALGESETEVRSPNLDLETIRFYGNRLYRRWTGDPTQDPLGPFWDQVFDRVRRALRKGTEPDLVAEVQAVLDRRTDDRFYLNQVRFRAGLSEGDLSIDQMRRPLEEWPDEILERIVPVLFEIGTAG